MKTRAFVVRILICLILSLIPLTDLENAVYSMRFRVRDQIGLQHRPPSRILIVEVPSDEFQSTTRLGAIQSMISGPLNVNLATRNDARAFLYDRDGVVRRTPGRTQPIWIDFRGPAGSIPRCTLKQVLGGIEGCEAKGRNVLLVDDVEDTVDLRTPVGDMSRAEVIANVWDTALTHPIYHVPYWLTIGMVLTMIVLVALFIIYYPVTVHALAVGGTALALVFVLFQLIFQLLNTYIPSANLGLSMLITYLVFSGYRLAYQENLQWRSLKQAQYLQELDQMKTNFLSLMSHDLKTPIARIQAVVERLRRESRELKEGEFRADWNELIDSIENSNSELKHHITGILNLSRIESQKIVLNKKSNDVNVLISQSLKRLRPLAAQKGIEIEEKLDPLFSVECDEDLMRQVISNLVDNAIKYSPSQSRVIVQSQEEASVVRVSVRDFGPGIPSDQLPRMFRKFSRLNQPAHPGPDSPSQPVKGTGLGLYLSKYFIELHGGSIRVDSTEGKGTTFSFTLPIELVK